MYGGRGGGGGRGRARNLFPRQNTVKQQKSQLGVPFLSCDQQLQTDPSLFCCCFFRRG